MLLPLNSLLRRYSDLLVRRPYATNLASAVVVSVTGDAIAQFVEFNSSSSDFRLDRNRCLTMLAWGGVITTPIWLTFYRKVDGFFHLKTLGHVMAKVGLAAALMTPPMNAGYMIFCTFFESYLDRDLDRQAGSSDKKSLLELWSAAKCKLEQDWSRVVLSSWSVWIPMNTVNWLFFPNHMRLVVTTIGNVFWNAYISFVQHEKQLEKPLLKK